MVRGPEREFISRSYNLILKGTFAACSPTRSAASRRSARDVAERLLPLVEDDNWFFDTELLVLAQRAGLRIHEVPVDWIDDPDSRVDIVGTAKEDLAGMARLVRGFATADPGGQAPERAGRDSACALRRARGAERAVRPVDPVRRRRAC